MDPDPDPNQNQMDILENINFQCFIFHLYERLFRLFKHEELKI